MVKDTSIWYVPFLNIIVLVASAINGYGKECIACSTKTIIPINNLSITLGGLFASMILCFLCRHLNNQTIRWTTILFSAFCAGFSFYLQILRYSRVQGFCYFCISATTIFYLLFLILFIKFCFLPLFNTRSIV